MVWSPSGKEVVDMLAVPPLTATGLAGDCPTTGASFSVNVTVPVVPTGGVLVMVAVKVTDVPLVLNVELGETLVDVDVPVPGETSRHHPPARLVVSPKPDPL